MLIYKYHRGPLRGQVNQALVAVASLGVLVVQCRTGKIDILDLERRVVVTSHTFLDAVRTHAHQIGLGGLRRGAADLLRPIHRHLRVHTMSTKLLLVHVGVQRLLPKNKKRAIQTIDRDQYSSMVVLITTDFSVADFKVSDARREGEPTLLLRETCSGLRLLRRHHTICVYIRRRAVVGARCWHLTRGRHHVRRRRRDPRRQVAKPTLSERLLLLLPAKLAKLLLLLLWSSHRCAECTTGWHVIIDILRRIHLVRRRERRASWRTGNRRLPGHRWRPRPRWEVHLWGGLN